MHFEGFSQYMLRLPLSLGGLGFTSVADQCPQAFVASVAATIPLINKTPIANFDVLKLPTFAAVEDAITTIITEHPYCLNEDALPRNTKDFLKKFRSPSASEGFQAHLTSRTVPVFPCEDNKLLRAHMNSRRTPHAASVFRAFPLTADFKLTDEEMHFTVAHATLNTPPEMPSLCSCGQPLTLPHTISCGLPSSRATT